MKKLLLFITAIFICGAAIAQTIRWHIGDTVYQTTTCNAGESITPPTAPEKFGYTFVRYDAYTPIEYLESTGTQWIDTGFYANAGFITEARIAPKLQNGIYTLQLGSISRTIGPGGSRNEFISNASSLYAEKGGVFGIANIKIIDDTPFDLYLDTSNKNFVAIINNQTYINRSDTAILPTQDKSVKIGYSDHEQRGFAQRNYYVKIWDSTNTLVRDFIPVLDPDDVPCLFDKVEQKFYYNAGTGQFIAGPVLTE